MLAVDGGVPARTGTAMVEVAVVRDEKQLSFSADEYTVDTTENADVGSVLFRVQASPGVSNYMSQSTSNALFAACDVSIVFVGFSSHCIVDVYSFLYQWSFCYGVIYRSFVVGFSNLPQCP